MFCLAVNALRTMPPQGLSSFKQKSRNMDDASIYPAMHVATDDAVSAIAESWVLAASQQVSASVEQFLQVTNLLLERVQLNSTHLFRADILSDSTGELRTLTQKNNSYEPYGISNAVLKGHSCEYDAPEIPNFEVQRTIIRRLIPRKPQLDNPLEQSCFVYKGNDHDDRRLLVVYIPHCNVVDEMPWYHPKVKALAYLFVPRPTSSHISVQYLPFPSISAEPSTRLDRTFLSLINTMVRLLKFPMNQNPQLPNHIASNQNILTMPLTAASLRDTILPQHVVQNTYTRLKQIYAPDLIARWIEKTEPSKHVFEDISIAAFLIELWNTMYDLLPDDKSNFPGFVDIACGNGVLVYVLINEGYRGYGFDARRRKTWEVLDIEKHVQERVCIPKPFLQALSESGQKLDGLVFNSGRLPRDTFIISNHADELTCWTPILAALSCPEKPLPFLAIPCCSHALDGSKHRYTTRGVNSTNTSHGISGATSEDIVEEQPNNGDLKALRKAKQNEIAGLDDKSMYACLTRKTVALAQELSIEVELTLMRIPSTRNIGIVGSRKKRDKSHDVLNSIEAIVRRECLMTGGVEQSAQIWLEKARKLQGGQGRGKVNLKGSTCH